VGARTGSGADWTSSRSCRISKQRPALQRVRHPVQQQHHKGRRTNVACSCWRYSPQCQTTSNLNPKPTNTRRCRVTLNTWIPHHGPGGTYQTLNTHWVRSCWGSYWGGSAHWVWSWLKLIQKLQDKGRRTNVACRCGSYSPECQTTSNLNPKSTGTRWCRVTLNTWIPHNEPGWYISITKHTLCPELLGLILGQERTLGLELAGAHPKAAGSPCSIRRSKDTAIQFSSNTIKA
jgi:hypothetical protein